MSSGGGILGGIVGGIVGFMIGGPLGAIKGIQYAAVGASIGSSVGTAIDPPKGPNLQGPRLGDVSVQTSTYGADIPRLHGKAGLMGNLIWLENNELKEVAKKEQQSTGGKGGGSDSSDVTTYQYFATFAIAFCKGEVDQGVKIWIGPDLIANTSSTQVETMAANWWLAYDFNYFDLENFYIPNDVNDYVSSPAPQKYRFYNGSETQLPDPRIEADVGIENAPAYRGICYVVIEDLPLKDYGNALPLAQVKMEIIKEATTSEQSSEYSFTYPLSLVNTDAVYANQDGIFLWEGNSSFTSDVNAEIKNYLINIHGSELLLNTYSHPFKAGGPTSYSRIGSFDTAFMHADINACLFIAKSGGTAFYSVALSSGVSETFQQDITLEASTKCYSCIKDNSLYVLLTFPTSSEIKIYKYDLGAGNTSPSQSRTIENITSFYKFGVLQNELVMLMSDSGAGYTYSLNSYSIDDLSDSSLNNMEDILGTDVQFTSVKTLDISQNYIYYDRTNLYIPNRLASLQGDVEVLGDSSADRFEPEHAFSQHYRIFEFGNLIINTIGYRSNGTGRGLDAFSFGIASQSATGLAGVIQQECSESNLLSNSDLDVSLITENINGYVISNTGSIRAALSSLQTCYPYDVIQKGYKIGFVPRGGAVADSVSFEELGFETQWESNREMETQIPSKIIIKYLDAERDYDVSQQIVKRINTESVNVLRIEIPIVLSATEAIRIIEVLEFMYSLERNNFSFTLPPIYRGLEPSDIISVSLENSSHEVRLTSINYTSDGALICTARPNKASAYTSVAIGQEGTPAIENVTLDGPSIYHLVDAPVIFESIQDFPGFSGVMSGVYEGWSGGTVYRTNDSGQTWENLQPFGSACTFGRASTVLTENGCAVLDEAGLLTVELLSGELSSVTELAMLNGANIALYGAEGRWEVIRFRDAVDNGDGTYTLSIFKRGDKGTEWTTGLHFVDDLFILATDPDNRFLSISTDLIGSERDYRGVTSGRPIEPVDNFGYTYYGTNLECYASIHPNGYRDASENLTITFTPRTRVGGAWRDYVDASLGESSESYSIDILNGSTVVRTLTGIIPSIDYTAAQQVTDFGSEQSAIDMNIYKLSSVVGRGRALEVIGL